jgi:putative glutamine amidotransferase
VSAPRIAVSGLVRQVQHVDRTGVNAEYVTAVIEGGGLPLVLSPLLGAGRAAEALRGCEGLLLSGGADIDPVRYGASPSPALGALEPIRDDFELALLAVARAQRLPILAICRGLQLVNVAAGGTLWQDLPTERPGPVAHEQAGPPASPTHAVRIEHGTRTADALGSVTLRVNSTHHQAIRDLGSGLRATGWAEDGVIEAVESSRSGEWLIGVQWHPERGSAGMADRGLFRAFVDAAAVHAQESSPSPR